MKATDVGNRLETPAAKQMLWYIRIVARLEDPLAPVVATDHAIAFVRRAQADRGRRCTPKPEFRKG